MAHKVFSRRRGNDFQNRHVNKTRKIEKLEDGSWKNYPMSDLANVNTSKTLSRDNSKPLIHVGLEHIVSNLNILKGYSNIDDVKTHRIFQKNNILYGKLRPNLNKVWLATCNGHCSTDILPLTVNKTKILPKFLLYLMPSQQFVQKATMASSGVGMPRVRWNDLQKFTLDIPLLSEQRRLVIKIESIFAEIDSVMRHASDAVRHAKTTSHSLDNLKQSVLDKTFRYDHYQNYRNSIQKTEKVVKLADIAVINPQKPPKGSVPPTTSVSFVPMRCVEAETGKIESHVTKQYHEVSKGYHYCQNDDILFAKITPCMENGKIALANHLTNGMGFATTEVYVIRLNSDDLLPKFYLWYLMQPGLRHRARQTMSGSAGQLRTPLAFLRGVVVPVPTMREQRRVVTKIESIFAKIDSKIYNLIDNYYIFAT